MADVLTHVLVGYILGTIPSWRYDWLEPHHVTLVMIAAYRRISSSSIS